MRLDVYRPILEGADELAAYSKEVAKELGLADGYATLKWGDEPRVSQFSAGWSLADAMAKRSLEDIIRASKIGPGSRNVRIDPLGLIPVDMPRATAYCPRLQKHPRLKWLQLLDMDKLDEIRSPELLEIILKSKSDSHDNKEVRLEQKRGRVMGTTKPMLDGVIGGIAGIKLNLSAIVPSQVSMEKMIEGIHIEAPKLELGKIKVEYTVDIKDKHNNFGFYE